MRESEVVKVITDLARPEVAALGLDIFEVTFKGGLLKVTIDKPSGVSMNDCVKVTKALGMLLDAEDPINGSYRLEVTSPGINRRLKKLHEFEYFAGRKVKIITKEREYIGTIKGLDGDSAVIETQDGLVGFKMHEIKKANLEFDF